MALAEARAAWQRTINRCLVQEDAKRAPKLACCPSVTPSLNRPETEHLNSDSSRDFSDASSSPFRRNPSYSNVFRSSKWWLLTLPSHGHRQVMTGEQFTPSMESQDLELSQEDTSVGTCEFSEIADDVRFNSEKTVPWWRSADTEELALLLAQRSLDDIENCDLPRPQSAGMKKDVVMGMPYFSRDEISTSFLVHRDGIGIHCLDSILGCSGRRCSCQKLRESTQIQSALGADQTSKDSPTTLKKTPDSDSSKAQLLEALRHSQTRAREAEEVMKRACTEKEHVVNLVLRQVSHIFAYRQWIHLLQLENMYFQFKKSKNESRRALSPLTQPNWATTRSRKIRKNSWAKCWSRKQPKRARPGFDVGKYVIVFALELGLVGAGLLLGWTIGWMLPKW